MQRQLFCHSASIQTTRPPFCAPPTAETHLLLAVFSLCWHCGCVDANSACREPLERNRSFCVATVCASSRKPNDPVQDSQANVQNPVTRTVCHCCILYSSCLKSSPLLDTRFLIKARQAMYIQYSIEAHSRNHYCHVKAIGIAYFCVRTQVSACVWVQGAGVCFHACSLMHPACNAHAPFCLWPRWFHKVFRHYLTNGTISGKKLLNIKCVF